jgi:hypothetical protein
MSFINGNLSDQSFVTESSDYENTPFDEHMVSLGKKVRNRQSEDLEVAMMIEY